MTSKHSKLQSSVVYNIIIIILKIFNIVHYYSITCAFKGNNIVNCLFHYIVKTVIMLTVMSGNWFK